MTLQRSLCCCIGILLLAGGCALLGPTCVLYQQHNDDNSWTLYLIDEQTQEPLANVEIERLDPIPNPGSIWSWIKYGDENFNHTKLTQTDAQGQARIFKSNDITLEARLDTAVLRFDFDKQEAKVIPWHLSNAEAQILKLHEVKPGHFTVMVPDMSASE